MRATWIVLVAALAGGACGDTRLEEVALPTSAARQVRAPDAGPLRVELPDPVAPDVRRRASVGPPPISGGTLLATFDGLLVAGDELTGHVFVFDPERRGLFGEIRLRRDAWPGRAVESFSGAVAIVLRGTGELLVIDPTVPEVLDRRYVCPAPRGVARDWRASLVHVACAGGELISLDETHHRVVRRAWLAPDLRDVVVLGDRLLVSRFRSAEVLVVDSSGDIVRRVTPPSEEHTGVDPPIVTVPRVAWRLRSMSSDRAWMIHQMHVASDLGRVARELDRPDASPYFPADPDDSRDLPAAIVTTRITSFTPDGDPGPGTTASAEPFVDALAEYDMRALVRPGAPDHSVAVAITQGRVRARLLQDPQYLLRLQRWDSSARDWQELYVERPERVAVPDLGWRAFHGTRDGMSCASCHPEGADDGHVWIDPSDGARRTQTLLGGLAGTHPYHWAGDLGSFDAVIDRQSARLRQIYTEAERVSMLAWLDGLDAPRGVAIAEPGAEAAFEEAGCVACHAGRSGSDGLAHDVGAGAMQTPRLLGVAQRPPYFHDGCAQALEQTLDGTCRAIDAHGVVDDGLRARVLERLRAF